MYESWWWVVGWVGFGYVLSTWGNYTRLYYPYTCFHYWWRCGQRAADLVPPPRLVLSFAFFFPFSFSHIAACCLCAWMWLHWGRSASLVAWLSAAISGKAALYICVPPVYQEPGTVPIRQCAEAHMQFEQCCNQEADWTFSIYIHSHFRQIVDSALTFHVLQLVNTLFCVWHGSSGYFMLRPFTFIGLNALDVPAETFRL